MLPKCNAIVLRELTFVQLLVGRFCLLNRMSVLNSLRDCLDNGFIIRLSLSVLCTYRKFRNMNCAH